MGILDSPDSSRNDNAMTDEMGRNVDCLLGCCENSHALHGNPFFVLDCLL